MAYLGILSWATAYAYGWGQAVYHGYPWWHVVQGGSMIARSLAYVCAVSVVLVVGYLVGYWLFRGFKYLLEMLWRSQMTDYLGFVKIFILLTVASIPIMLLLYFYVGIWSFAYLIKYLLGVLLVSLVFHKLGKRDTFFVNFREFVSNEKYYQLFMGFIFVYVIVSAFSVGYLRSAFFVGYDKIKVEGNFYYILAINGDEDFILGESIKDNHYFIFFNRKTLNHYTVHITPIAYLPFYDNNS